MATRLMSRARSALRNAREVLDEGTPRTSAIFCACRRAPFNQLLDEELSAVADPPPPNAEPFTRQFLRMFDGVDAVPRDQIQKYLRGTGSSPADFEQRGWCRHEKKVYHLVPPLEIARAWIGRHRQRMVSDYDQAAFPDRRLLQQQRHKRYRYPEQQ